MTEAKHTPGPWVQDRYGSLNGSDGEPIGVWGLGISHVTRSRNSESNARLIAAAPELLEALQKMLNDNNFYFPAGNPWGDAARAAIAKATGN